MEKFARVSRYYLLQMQMPLLSLVEHNAPEIPPLLDPPESLCEGWLNKDWLIKSSFCCFIIAVCGDLHIASSCEATSKPVLRRKLKLRAVPYLVLPPSLRHSHLRQSENGICRTRLLAIPTMRSETFAPVRDGRTVFITWMPAILDHVLGFSTRRGIFSRLFLQSTNRVVFCIAGDAC